IKSLGIGGVVEESCMNYQSGYCGTRPCSSSCSCNNRCAKPCTCDLCSDYKSRMYTFESYEIISNEFYSYNAGPYVKAYPEKIKRALVCNGPLITASLHFPTSTGWNGAHAIVLVGYDDEKKVWIIKNSWGRNFGENGYGKLPYNSPAGDLIYYTIAVKNVRKVS
ncbi:MAG: C1 family peptidase, partial [Candidatus Woesearchaeota archaeon]